MAREGREGNLDKRAQWLFALGQPSIQPTPSRCTTCSRFHWNLESLVTHRWSSSQRPNRYGSLCVCCATLMRCTHSRQVSHLSSHTSNAANPHPPSSGRDRSRGTVRTWLSWSRYVSDVPKIIPISTLVFISRCLPFSSKAKKRNESSRHKLHCGLWTTRP